MENQDEIKIVELEDSMIPEARALVAEVFPEQSCDERLSFWAHKHRRNPFMKMAFKLYGYMDFSKYWVALDADGKICGTTGLYSKKSDIHEAIWLSWFCVAPGMRGRGLGKRLLEFSVEEARRLNKKYLRLYTSDDPGEAEAQFLYEKYGFKMVKTEKERDYTIIYREKVL